MSSSCSLMREFPSPTDRQVVIDNMQQGPFNRWAFAQMRRLLPSANIWRGDRAESKMEVALLDIAELEFADHLQRSKTFAEMFSDDYTDGLVVLKDGIIVVEQYRCESLRHEPHLLMSVSKSVVGSLTGILVDRGQLSVDDRVTDIIPEVAGSAYDQARVRHLLDMTIGIEFDENYTDPDSDVALLDVAAGWRTPRAGAVDNLRDYIATMRKSGPHGNKFHYVSTNTDLLGWILERVSGVDFANLLSREIWQPMGAENDAYVTLDRLGAPQTDGGLCVTTRDLARFGQLHLQQGMAEGRQIVPADWIADLQQNGDSQLWDRGNFAEVMPGYHYRSKWYTKLSDPHRPYKGIGIHGQFLVVDPVSAVVIAHHASHPAPVEDSYFADLDRAFSALGHHLT